MLGTVDFNRSPETASASCALNACANMTPLTPIMTKRHNADITHVTRRRPADITSKWLFA